jgi:MFS transporter, OFA family, oxalate/formate antiporter
MKGYFILAASLVIQLCLGSIYAWSTFVPALVTSYGLTQAQSQVLFGVTIAVFTISMIFAGRLQDRFGPAPVAFTGGVLFGTGYLLASFSGGTFILLMLSIGIVTGMGMGFGYVCPVATCIKWFPKQKGFVGGLAVAGFGGGAVLVSLISNYFFAQGKDILVIFRLIGIWYGGIILIASLLLSNPEHSNLPVSPKMNTNKSILSGKTFWRLVIGMLSGTFGGLLVIGNLKPIGLSSNVGAVFATVAISTFAIGNVLGRLCWGIFTDKIGARAIPASLVFLAISVAALLFDYGSGLLFVIVAGLTGFGFGACFVVYMAQTANEYGPAEMGNVYPLVFLAYGVSGIAGPTVGGWLYDLSGTYSTAIMIAAGVSVSGAVIHQFLR